MLLASRRGPPDDASLMAGVEAVRRTSGAPDAPQMLRLVTQLHELERLDAQSG
jgi:hypothetical protein